MIELKKIAYVLPFLLIFSNTHTYDFFRNNNASRQHAVTLNTFGQFGSNAITTDFVYSFLNGQYLDDATKDPVRDKLGRYNRAGFDWMTEISYLNMGDSVLGKHWGYYLGIKNRMYADTRFNQDLFNLTFYGNRDYAGQTADFGNLNADLVMYQQFQVGFVKQIVASNDLHTLGFGVSFINGNLRNSITGTRGTLYTEANGDYLDIDAAVSLQRTDPTHTNFLANNGSGLSADFFYEGRLDEKNIVSLSLNDFGFINWDRPGDQLSIDSTLHFTGVQVENIFTTTGTDFSNFADTMSQYLHTRSDYRYGLMMLPINLSLSYTRLLGERVMLQGGMQLRTMNGFSPLIYAKGIFYPHKHVMIGTTIGYGGFTTLNVGLDLGFDFGKGWIVQINTRNLEGVVPNTFGTGLSAGFTFNKMF